MINFETVVAVIIFIIGIILSAIAIRVMSGGKFESREKKMEREISLLRNTIDLINEDRIRDRMKIESLEKQLAEANAKITELERVVNGYKTTYSSGNERTKYSESLLVVIGSDPALKIDLATLRAVKRISGMNFTRILNAKFEDFHRVMSENRLAGKPIRRVLFSVHSDERGILLGGRIVGAEELSAELQDVEVLMIAGCESSEMGQWLGVAKYVVTLREKVPMDDASRFVEAFWTAIGKRVDPEDSFYDAIEKVPAVSEHAELHC